MSDELKELREELRSLSVEELAQVMGVQPWRVYQMVRVKKAPPSFRIGKTIRFPLVGVRKWFAEQTGTQPER